MLIDAARKLQWTGIVRISNSRGALHHQYKALLLFRSSLMKTRLIAVLIVQVVWFSFVSQPLGSPNSYFSPNRSLNGLSCGYFPDVDILPGLPLVSDTISITASGTWPDACFPHYQAHQMMSNSVRIDAVVNARPGTLCPAVVLPWEFTIGVGNLPAGLYQVDLYITDHRYSEAPGLCASTSFAVLNYPPHKTFLPIVSK